MPEQTSPDPTMDEILASIRRIITSDDAPADEAAPAAPKPEPDPPVHHGDPEVTHTPPEASEIPPEPVEPAPLVGSETIAATTSAFDRLTAAVGVAVRTPSPALPPEGRTVEDLITDLLRPMLKAWLDENLPEIVRDQVEEEVKRIARGRVR